MNMDHNGFFNNSIYIEFIMKKEKEQWMKVRHIEKKKTCSFSIGKFHDLHISMSSIFFTGEQ